MRLRFLSLIASLALVFSVSTFAQTVAGDLATRDVTTTDSIQSTYLYPMISNDLSTICSPGIHVPKVKSESFKVQVLKRGPGTGEIRLRPKLNLRYYRAPKPTSDVLLVIGGLGAETNSQFSKFYAQKGQEWGSHVLVFPNTFSPNFILSSSTNGLVGETPVDVVDLYRAIRAALAKLEAMGVKNQNIRVLGYSHGAILSSALDKINEEQNAQTRLNFHSVMLVNPPVSLLSGLRGLDARVAQAKKISLPKLITLGLRYKKSMDAARKIATTNENFNKFSTAIRFTPEEQYALIGFVMHSWLADAIIASQRVEDLGILPEVEENSAVVQYERAALHRQAASYSFEDYINVFFGARAEKQGYALDVVGMDSRASLTAYETHLKTASHVYVAHNSDDILFRKGDVEWLQGVFGPRIHFFPRGGHMGNIWMPDNIAYLHSWYLK